MLAFGLNQSGQLGTQDTAADFVQGSRAVEIFESRPKRVAGLRGVVITSMSAGLYHSVAVSASAVQCSACTCALKR